MPVSPTYPGVYIQELPSAVHAITGATTSVAAFAGWAPQGPTNEATLVQSWMDYQRIFGGLYANALLGYSVNQFFANGGQQAYIVRLSYAPQATVNISTSPAETPAGVYVFTALQPGLSGLSITVSQTVNNVFNLTVSLNGVTVETYNGLTGPSVIPTINSKSEFVNVELALPPSNQNPQNNLQYQSAPYNLEFASSVFPTDTPDKVGYTLLADTTSAPALFVAAQSPGNWSINYGITIQDIGSPVYDATANPNPRFSLSVVYSPQGGTPTVVENYHNLSMNPGDPLGRYVASIIGNASSTIQVVVFNQNKNAPATITSAQKLLGGAIGNVLQPLPAGSGNFENLLQASNAASGSTGGIGELNLVDFDLLAVPGLTDYTNISNLQQFCINRRAFMIVDSNITDNLTYLLTPPSNFPSGANGTNSAFYFPWVNAFDPLLNKTNQFPPSGFVAGIYAATDSARGVWKAPAGINAELTGISGLYQNLTDLQNGSLNPLGINCLRNFPVYGNVVWGARTLDGADALASQWKYVPVRRLALYIEKSLLSGTQWVVFQPNDATLWSAIRLNINAFMQGLFRQGAFFGSTPQQAYFVKCDSETTTQTDISNGIVNIQVGFAPVQPAEFVVIQIQQSAGQTQG
jgi:hypothetical protein